MTFSFEKLCDSMKHRRALILCDRGVVKDFCTYEEVKNIADSICAFISKNINEHTCVGLVMTHNMYIPSITMSLQRLEHAFMFLDSKTEDWWSNANRLGIKWILSFNDNLENFVVEDKLTVRNESLFLLKNQNSALSNCNYLNIFCVVKTSGTTGESKFVKVENYCIESNVKSLSKSFNVTEQDIVYFGTPLTFDPSLVELLVALYNGACLLIVPQNHKINVNFLYDSLFPVENSDYKGVTILQMVPSIFLRWPEQQIKNILLHSNLNVLALGGESFPKSLLKYEKSSNLKIFNLYGITEVSCWATIHAVNGNEAEVPIGQPLDETIIEVRNESGHKISNGKGEIFIGSNSRICHINEEIHRDFSIFRATGDLAKIDKDTIFYLARKNDVIKRFGHKVNLSKIEELIMTETGLSNKCIWCKRESKLLSFLIVEEFNSSIKHKILDKLRVKLLHSLPHEYFPDFIELIPKFPVTSHGKLDKRYLENIYLTGKRNCGSESPDCLFKSLLCRYFGLGELQLTHVMHNTFFEIGGNSVLGIQLLSEFADLLKFEYSSELVTFLFEKDLNSCLDHLKNFHPKQKRAIDEVNCDSALTDIKRIKTDIELQINWTYNFNACVDSSPIVCKVGDITVVAVGSFSHIFAVVNAQTGEEVSKFVLPDAIESSACLSPCQNYLYVGCFDGKMYCLDYMKGDIKWEYSTSDRIKCTPHLCRHSTAIVFGSYDKYIHCVNISDGTCVWKTFVSEGVVSSPLCVQNIGEIYVATIFGTCLCVSEKNGEVLWAYKCGNPIFGSPCLIDNCVIWPNVQGILHCLSNDGKEICKFSCKGHIYSSLITRNNCVIFGCHDHNLHVVEINSCSKLLYAVPLSGAISSTPCLYNLCGKDVIVTATNCGVVYLIDFDKGQIISELRLPGNIFSSPCVNANQIYVGCRDNNLYCIDIIKVNA